MFSFCYHHHNNPVGRMYVGEKCFIIIHYFVILNSMPLQIDLTAKISKSSHTQSVILILAYKYAYKYAKWNNIEYHIIKKVINRETASNHLKLDKRKP